MRRRRVGRARAAVLAIGLATAACGADLPGLDDDFDLQVVWAVGQGYYSGPGDWYDLSFDALVINGGDGRGELERWSFTLERRGQTIATIDAGSLAQYGLAISELDTDVDNVGGRVMLNSGGSAPGRPFYGADPPDKVVFRCTVDKEHGGAEEVRGEGDFLHTEG